MPWITLVRIPRHVVDGICSRWEDSALRSVPMLLALTLALGCSACGGSSASHGAPNRPAVAVVTMSAPSHHPTVGAPWPIVIRARDSSGAPLKATVRYEFLFGGSVVARRSHYRFRGVHHDTLRWPANSVGVPLTFRAVVTTPLGTRRLDYSVQVKR